MDRRLRKKVNEYLSERKERKKRTVIISVISVVLAFSVAYMTLLSAVTLTSNSICGLEEHTHTAACYEDVLVCGQAEDEGHIHTEACFKEVKTSVCEKEEHVHTDACYEEVKTLICTLEEDENHTHTDSCYKTERVLICGKEEHTHAEDCLKTERILICGQEEREAHMHTAECYEKQLICGKTEHVHTEDCYKNENGDESLVRTYEDNGVTVTAALSAESMIPEEAVLSVVPITEDSNKGSYDSLVEKAGDEVLDENQIISDIRLYDISFNLNGEKIEPAEGTVKVSIRFSDPVFSVEDVRRASELKVLHFADTGDVVDVTDVVENAEEGVTAVEFSTDSFSPFCIVLADTTQAGNFYQRVNKIDSTSASYLIVSAQGNYALSSTQTGNARAAIVNPVKGNPTYFTAKVGAADAAGITDINWFFNTLIPGTSGASRVQVDATHRLRLGNAAFISTTAENQTLDYSALTKCWTIVQSGYYLYMTPGSGSGVFSRNNGTTSTENRNVVIYKLVNVTLTIPGDVIYDDGTGQGGGETKPPYDPYITPSGAKSASYTTLSGKTISAVSDAATSQIESRYTGVKADDGKVVTDKSVIYGDDDYGAFTNYADGEFGVTLSALAQQFNIVDEEMYIAPIDVFIIMDTSGSMTVNNVPSGESRSRAAVNALNNAIDYIMQSNPGNRVGVVNFSSGSWDFMQLGRYYVGTAGATIDYSAGYNYAQLSGTGMSDSNMYTNPALRFANTRALATPVSFTQWYGTYSQMGIAQAGAMMLRNSDTTYTDPSTGDVVNRTPVVIMISDGDPTHCTSNYMDPLSGPHYGSGSYGGASNNKGILGYNTILTANYFKMQTSIHYKEVTKWFSIGLGIYESGYDDMSGASATGDHYKRATLNPTPGNIAYLNSATAAKNYTTTAQQMYQLLNGTYSGNTVTVDSASASTLPNLGLTNRYVPVLSNQYTNYKFADDAFFGDFTGSELDAVLERAINQSREVYNYGFILRQSSKAEIIDPIGEGMDVKGAPVLRFGGTNYTHTSEDSVTNAGSTVNTYHYNYTYTDPHTTKVYNLNDIEVDITTDGSGNQTVRMLIPEYVMPVYLPDQAQSFYYEALPARLIYQVGLTAAALSGAQKDDVFYTNRWESGTSSTAVMLPTEDNPYYMTGINHNTTQNKTVNTSATLPAYYVTDMTAGTLTHKMGNNGRLIITAAPEFVSVTVNKVWLSNSGAVISDPAVLATLPNVTMNLYKSITSGNTGTLYKTVTIGNSNGWTHTWTDLPGKDGSGNLYYYYIIENPVNGYTTTYRSVQNNCETRAGTITVTNTAGGIILPPTGGPGVYGFISGGIIILIMACWLYIKRQKYGRRFIHPPDV